LPEEREHPVGGSDGKPPKVSRHRRPEGQSDDISRMRTPRFPRDPSDPSRKMRTDLVPHKKPKMDIEHIARVRAKTAEEAARVATIAVAEAEAAAAAAEQAAWDAEAAEAEAEALEAAAEAAMAAIRPPKKCKSSHCVNLGDLRPLSCLRIIVCEFMVCAIPSVLLSKVSEHVYDCHCFSKCSSVFYFVSLLLQRVVFPLFILADMLLCCQI